MESVRLLLAMAAAKDWRVHHLDVKSAFLNGELAETVFVKQAPGFAVKGTKHMVLKLRKTLYGLRQAPRAWNAKLDATSGLGSLAALQSTCSTRGDGGRRNSSSACMWTRLSPAHVRSTSTASSAR